jgi:hypothetical protein
MALTSQGHRNSGDSAAPGHRSVNGVTPTGDGAHIAAAPASPNLRVTVSAQRSSADTAVSLALGLGRGGTGGSNSPLGTRSSLALPTRSPRAGSAGAGATLGAINVGRGQLGAVVGSEADALDVHLSVLETMSAQGTGRSSGQRSKNPWHSSSSLGREAAQSAAGRAGVAQVGSGHGEEEGVVGRMKVPHRFRSNTLQVSSTGRGGGRQMPVCGGSGHNQPLIGIKC